MTQAVFDKSILEKFSRLATWKRNDERAPHKPLLALWSIGRCLQGKKRLVEYETAGNELLSLLEKFAPPRKKHRPHDPFWRMQRDQVWEIPLAAKVPRPKYDKGGVSPAKLRELNISGGFPQAIFEKFRRNRAFAIEVAQVLVSAHFPETMHGAVLQATLGNEYLFGLKHDDQFRLGQSQFLESVVNRRKRNSKFRKAVLESYNFRCAVCDFSFEYPTGHWPALEAAHIKWHSHCGPDNTRNGLSLCVLHHELFDWGVFTIRPDSLDVIVAKKAPAQRGGNPILEFHGNPLTNMPVREEDRPETSYLEWHAKNVFRSTGFPA